jgi:hypothetical protein
MVDDLLNNRGAKQWIIDKITTNASTLEKAIM